MTTRRLLLLCTTAALLIAGCRSNKQLPIAPPKRPQTAVVPKPQPKPAPSPRPEPEHFSTFSGTFTCTVQGNNVNGLVRMQRDSVIWISASKFIELGRARITPDSVIAYVKPLNQYLRCSMTDLKRIYGVDMDFQTIQRILTGEKINSPVVKSVYASPTTINKQSFPQHINVNITDKRLRASSVLKFSKIELDNPLSFPIQIPKSATPLKVK